MMCAADMDDFQAQVRRDSKSGRPNDDSKKPELEHESSERPDPDKGSHSPKRTKKTKPKRKRTESKQGQEEDEFPEDEFTGMIGLSMDEVAKVIGETEWVWHPYIPEGLVSMIVGPQGNGKSYLNAHLIAVFTGTKQSWPDGTSYQGKVGPVLLLETEGMRAEYINRLKRLGVPSDMVAFPAYDDEDQEPIDKVSYVADLTGDMQYIELLAIDRGASAIIIDSLSGGHGIDENSDRMKLLLQNLSRLAIRTQIPVIVTHHSRKKNPAESQRMVIDRVRGSSTITQFCRSVVALFRLIDDMVAPVRVEQIKANLTAPGDPFGFTISDDGLVFHEAPEMVRPQSALEIAMAFLVEQLEDGGPIPSRELRDKAEKEGIAKDTLYKARQRLGVQSQKDKEDGRVTMWVLPEITNPVLHLDLGDVKKPKPRRNDSGHS